MMRQHHHRRRRRVHAELFGQAGQHHLGLRRQQWHLAAQKELGVEPAQRHVRVSHGWLAAALTIAGRARLRAGTARADAEGAAGIDQIGDRAAARADRVYIELWRRHWKTGNPGVARAGLNEAARRHNPDIGAGAANIKGDQPLAAGRLGQPRRPPAPRRPGR